MISRRVQIDERRQNKKALFLFFLSAFLLAIFIKFGIDGLGQLGVLINEQKGTPQTGILNSQDKTPPVPPYVNPLPKFTKEKTLTVTGSAEANSKLKIYDNDTVIKEMTVSDVSGFSSDITLQQGTNAIWVTATDQAGNTSDKSSVFNVVYNTEPPDLNITFPTDGQTFYGDKEKTIEIKGTTNISGLNINVTVNGRIAKTDDNGNFSLSYELSQGENNLSVQATDQAGNTTTKDIKVSFNP